jgi:hypothetical protein
MGGAEVNSENSVAGASERDVYVRLNPAVESVSKRPLPARTKALGVAYKLKQYSTDALIIGGTLTVCALLLFPVPFLSAVVGGALGAACVVAGVGLKHYFYRQAYKAGALVESVGRLNENVNHLDSEIEKLEKTRWDIRVTASSLASTREDLQGEVGRLETQVAVLNREVAEAFDQLNVDRATFEQEKNAMLRQLADEIFEADERGDRAQTKLDRLNEREDRLRELKAELEARRKDLVRDEAKLASLQERLIAHFTRH